MRETARPRRSPALPQGPIYKSKPSAVYLRLLGSPTSRSQRNSHDFERRPIHEAAREFTGESNTMPQNKSKPMKHKLKYYGLSLLTAAVSMFVALPAPAQEITGTPGSPSATTTISGEQTPAPAGEL